MVQKDVFKHHRRAEMCDVYQASTTLAKKVPRYPRYWDASKMLITVPIGYAGASRKYAAGGARARAAFARVYPKQVAPSGPKGTSAIKAKRPTTP